MDELIKQITSKTGISAAQAKDAVDSVMKFISEKLPAPLAEQVKAALTGGGAANLGDVAKGIGDLLGKK